MNKRAIYIATLFALFLAWMPQAIPAAAQDDATSQNQAARTPLTPDQVVAKLDNQLSLTDDQKAKITPIIADRQEKLRNLQSESMRRRKKAREMKAIFQDSDKKIEAVLTDQQKSKYEQMQEQMREQMKQRWQQRKEGGNGGSF